MKLRIKELREEHQLTQKELAAKIDNAQRNVSNWEAGVSEPDCDTILRLAELFDVSIDELFGREHYDYGGSNTAPNLDGEFAELLSRLNAEQKTAVMRLIKAFSN